MGRAVVEAVEVHRTYAGEAEVRALAGANLTVEAGELVGIGGPSGSGKSTLLHILGAIDPPSSGTVRVADQDPWRMDDEQRARLRLTTIGFVFQDPQLVPELSVEANVALPARARGLSSTSARDRARQLLDRFGLSHRLEHRPAELSGGEAQRVGVARALVNEPSLLLLDEPTSHLDDAAATNLLVHVTDFVEDGGCAVLTSHDPRTLPACDRRMVLADGRLVTPSGSPRSAAGPGA